MLRASNRWTAPAIADELGVSQRTVFRDLRRVQEAGIGVRIDSASQGYRVDDGAFLPPLDLTTEEAIALTLLSRWRAAEPAPLARPASSALAKLRASLPSAFRDEIDEILPRLTIAPAAGEGDGADDVWATVAQAIASRSVLRCVYEPAGGAGDGAHGEPFSFNPYELYFGQRAWYAVGLHHGRGELRTLKLSRFSRIEFIDGIYEIPDDFSLVDYFGRAWRMIRGDMRHAVTLRFDAVVAETVADTRWHPTQEEELNDDGSVTMRFEVDGLDEIQWWILSYGPHCTIVAPDALRERVASLATATVRLYAQGSRVDAAAGEC